ncbi:TlpA family protein disulfide reductase [Streptomyces sp. NPDC101225]|uniref:TlpA family protein disulfide reductase n=1 Tax=Streptomyces sp. NPDC101225 TaxID=3366135 RepID=UPI003808133B
MLVRVVTVRAARTVALVAAGADGVLHRRRSGRVRVRGRDDGKRLGTAEPGGELDELGGELGALGGELGERATLVQFSSAFCAPCRATRRVLEEVAGLVRGVTHVEIDAEAHLDLVRALGILRTPTVLVLDARGRVVRRATGQPRKADVIAALGEAVGRSAAAG